MIQALKQSALGKAIYRTSRQPGFGAMRKLLTMGQSNRVNPRHLLVRNKQHNRTQERILQAFVRENQSKS